MKKLLLALLGAALLLPVHTFAVGAAIFTVPIVNATFSPLCTAVPTSVTLNGHYHITVHTSQNPDGTYTTKFQSLATGTAIDNTGQTYVFNYINHEQDVSSNPGDNPPIIGVFSDRFSLLSQGNAPKLRVVFQLAFVIDSGGNFHLTDIVAIKGDPNCDPI